MTGRAVDISVVLVSWNTRDLTMGCLETLPAAAGELSWEVWLVDNASTDDSVARVRALHPHVNVIPRPTNGGFAVANNEGIVASTGRWILLLNTDTEMPARGLERLVRFADAHPRAGAVGAMLINPDGTFQAGPSPLPTIWNESLAVTGLGPRLSHAGYPSAPEWACRHDGQAGFVGGACLLMRREAVASVGLLDEGYFMYSEETDWCRRARRAGFEVWYTPEVRVLHYGGQSTQQVRDEMRLALLRSKVRYFRLHHGPWAAATIRAAFVATGAVRRVVRRLRGCAPGRGVTWRALGGLPDGARVPPLPGSWRS